VQTGAAERLKAKFALETVRLNELSSERLKQIEGILMEARIAQVRSILNRLTDRNSGAPRHSGKGRFWNLPRDQFIAGPIYGKVPIVPGHPEQSFLVTILKGPAGGIARMPPGGPYISDTDLAFITQWVADGAPDADHAFMAEFNRVGNG
jgi:hypothetical protein